MGVDFLFKSDMAKNMDHMKTSLSFDLLMFTNTSDYLCYVEAVHQLQHERIKRHCDFVTNDKIYMGGIYEKDLKDNQFLVQSVRAQEYFFVIDNTDYPEALFNSDWIPKEPTP